MCSRNNFYTAVTRARKTVVLITDRNAMHLSLRKVI
jgi:ATP-dependent exoDNAse (exonuclease V) alpha subunit